MARFVCIARLPMGARFPARSIASGTLAARSTSASTETRRWRSWQSSSVRFPQSMNTLVESKTDLKQFAADIVAQAVRAGASDAEVTIREGDEFSTLVRMGEVETLKESGSRGMGLRVLMAADHGYRVASTSSSDFSSEGIEHLVKGALALAHVTSVDPFAGLAETGEFGSLSGDLELYYEDVYSLPTAERIDYARRAEGAALSAYTRITN